MTARVNVRGRRLLRRAAIVAVLAAGIPIISGGCGGYRGPYGYPSAYPGRYPGYGGGVVITGRP